jgi:hypothetical protein
MSDLIDLTGQTFGGLTVLRQWAATNKTTWLCRCACGEKTTVSSVNLRKGKVVSCGCWRANPKVRGYVRNQLPPERRSEIARMGAAAHPRKLSCECGKCQVCWSREWKRRRAAQRRSE